MCGEGYECKNENSRLLRSSNAVMQCQAGAVVAIIAALGWEQAQ